MGPPGRDLNLEQKIRLYRTLKIIFYVLNNNFSFTQLFFVFLPRKDSYCNHDDTDTFFIFFIRKTFLSVSSLFLPFLFFFFRSILIYFTCFFFKLFFAFLIIFIYHFYIYIQENIFKKLTVILAFFTFSSSYFFFIRIFSIRIRGNFYIAHDKHRNLFFFNKIFTFF